MATPNPFGPQATTARGMGPTGLAAFLQQPGLRQALMAAGSALLQQKDQPGSLGGALGRALPVGMQAFQQGRQEAEMDAVIAGAPEGMQRLLRALPKDRAVEVLLGQMQRPTPVAVGANERLVDPTTGQAIVDAMPEVEEVPTEIKTFREYLSMSPDERAAYDRFQEARRGPSTTVNVGGAEGGVQKAISERAHQTITEGADSAQAALQQVGSIDRIIEITSDPAFKNVSGPLFGGKFGELSARFADDPRARALLAEFNAIGGQMTMAQLEAFTGPKTDFEFQQARRLAFNDTNMTPEEIQAGLRVYRRIAIENARKWADNMLELDPERLNFDPRDVAPQLDLARQIETQFSAGGSESVTGGAGAPTTEAGQRLLQLLNQPRGP